jgi:hypothetical protein
MTELEEKKEPKACPVQSIKDHINKLFGVPDKLLKTDVIHVYGNKYRVNVWVRTGDGMVPQGRIAHSYFVSVGKSRIHIQG